MTFEWDSFKAKSNLWKHGVSFEEASTALLDTLSKTALDPVHSFGEQRFITFGVSARQRLLVVAYTDDGETIRIISARLATGRERQNMKNIKQDLDDSLRPEYRRSDFGEMVRGKYAKTQLQFAELVRLLLRCIGEDEHLTFEHRSPGNQLAGRKRGDWTYELGNANQITLRYWLSEYNSLEEPLSPPTGATTNEAGTELQKVLIHHVRALKTRVEAHNQNSRPGEL